MYYSHLRTFFRWMAAEDVVESSPMDRITAPVARPDQIQPFTQEQVEAILKATKKSRHPRRDKAIILFLLDTGVRASELCSLKMCDVDLSGRSCRVLGKGNKFRSLSFSRETAKVLNQYLQQEDRQEDDFLFRADRGTQAGYGLTRSGLFQLVQRLGKVAGIQAARCSPHTFRHTCAVEFLRAGGGVFVLKAMLGHNSLAVTNRYCAISQSDIQSQHQKFSPVERLRKRRE
jgi:site-specific recombinase XerD